jgi:hypothetical protein
MDTSVFSLQEDYENYQSLCTAPPNTALFEIVCSRDFNSHQLLLMAAYSSISIRNSKLLEHLKAILRTINCSYTSFHQCFQPLIFAG